jgi:hypothetical protein
MLTIHNDPGFRIEARVTTHPITGKTVELFQVFPQARHPRSQRLTCLTLPQESFDRLAALFKDDGEAGHANAWHHPRGTCRPAGVVP